MSAIRADGDLVLGDPHVTVVAVPAGHPYVRSVTSSLDVRVLPDSTSASTPSQWWPPAALDPDWIRAHAKDADLMHIHFGTESFTPEHLTDCLSAAREVGWPVVFTVHDIEHPQLDHQDGYLEQLDVLIPGSDAVLTLTHGAAEEIRRRWGRSALIVRHPSVLPPDEDLPAVAESTELRIGMHLKDLRPNIDAVAMVRALAVALEIIATSGLEVVAEVRMHREVRDEESREAVREIAGQCDRMLLIEHGRLDDRELESCLAGLDAYVLPYGHGTHSGWLELCWDLALPVVTPQRGFYAEQHREDSHASFSPDPTGESLAEALVAVLDAPDATRPGSEERRALFEARRAHRLRADATGAAIHAALYRQLVGERRS
ncbi:hypothetical protein ASC59_03570 [Leifsonia sp. Root1293]|nr:hypothetical protein ASC59_03570 [Leifsonia sp. Root1293]KRA12689.1 hypothetical protein ASD61_03570 [Leifsonia sp. Root60]